MQPPKLPGAMGAAIPPERKAVYLALAISLAFNAIFLIDVFGLFSQYLVEGEKFTWALIFSSTVPFVVLYRSETTCSAPIGYPFNRILIVRIAQ